MELNPQFDFIEHGIGINDIKADVEKHLKVFEPIQHKEILKTLLDFVTAIDYKALAFTEYEELKKRLDELLEDRQSWGSKESTGLPNNLKQDERVKLEDLIDKMKVKQKHYIIISVEQILELAQANDWGICKNHHFVYLYNGAYWGLFDSAELQVFFGKASEKMGVGKWEARYYLFREQLYKQFLAVANLPKPEQQNDTVLINLKNGTFAISPTKQELRPPDKADFITYQLPFEFNPQATAPLFQKYLDTVQPDKDRQKILAEYLAYLFIKPSTLKLEKTLLLYGTGANGKSVFFEVVNALLGGNENVSSYSLQNLTNDNGYFRAMLANKLVNYASEINGKLETSIFKQLVSGEPVDARLPYGEPFTLTNYAKLIFNCNELPKDVEQTNAYFRRFLIVPFDVTIPEAEQDKQLPQKIIANELSGVFNWVLEGLKRLLIQKNFTDCEAVRKQIEQYRLQSDSVQMFLQDEGFEKSIAATIDFKDLFGQYRSYCNESGYHSCSKKTFGDRLRNTGFVIERKMHGMVVFVQK
jgi:putative DNA primase/helicase